MEGIATYTECTIYHEWCFFKVSCRFLSISDLHVDFKWMSRKKGYSIAKASY